MNHKHTFNTVGLLGKPNNPEVAETATTLFEHLKTRVDKVIVEELIAMEMSDAPDNVVTREQLAEQSDLVIVVGGDGSMLNAGRLLVNYD